MQSVILNLCIRTWEDGWVQFQTHEHADQMNKNPSVFKKLFNGSSIEQEAMDIFIQEEGRRDGTRVTNLCQSSL